MLSTRSGYAINSTASRMIVLRSTLERSGGALAGEREKVLDDPGTPVHGVGHLPRSVHQPLVRRGLLENVRVTGNDRQRVVQLVGDAGKKRSHRPQLLALAQAGFHPLAFGDVPDDGHDAG